MPQASRLIFVEGVIGAGKSTTASFIARQLQQSGRTAHYVFEGTGEGGGPHPTRMMADLPRPFAPWLDLTPAEYVAQALRKWRAAVQRILRSGTVAVFDGQLFHGNMVDLLLMDASREQLDAFVREILTVTAELDPQLVYLRPDNLARAIDTVVSARGPKWEQYQTNWKLASPYAERQHLTGRAGLVSIYQAQREIADATAGLLGANALRIDTDAGAWPDHRRQILQFLGLPPAEDTDRSWAPGPPLPGAGVWDDDADRDVPMTGLAVSELAAFDKAMVGLLKRWQLPGAALALTIDGRLVLARGYGLAHVEQNELVQPDTRFRIGSVTKPFTATAILQLVEQGRLLLDEAALPLLDHLEPPPGAQVDQRIWQITVRQLLQHAGGWDRERSFDPLLHRRTPDLARELNFPEPITPETVIRIMLGQPLDFEPGARYAYSNLGYCILGRIIEKLTGQTYVGHVTSALLHPLGITRMQLGTSMLDGLADGEAHYYDPSATTIKPGHSWWSYQLHDSVGGWIASPIDLVRFMVALDGQRGARLLQSETLRLIEEPPAQPLWHTADSYTGLGWNVLQAEHGTFWGHSGRLRRFMANVLRGPRDGRATTRAVTFNSEPVGHPQFHQEVRQVLREAHLAVTDWPTHDLFDVFET